MIQAAVAVDPANLVQAELASVEHCLLEASASEIEVIQEAARHILGAGGKRLRPLLVLLSALASNGSVERAVPLAAACELVHTATLVHDDIVDDSDSRRGRTAVQFHFGNSASVLMGDYLVIRSFRAIAEEPDRRFWQILVDTIGRMCEGEVLQICVKSDTEVSVEVYETVIECKTALLISTCTRFGGMLGTLPEEQVEALADFGYQLGMAFQIQDDILDFIGTEDELGKPVGGDLREGKVTLPVILALQRAGQELREELLGIYEKAGPLTAAEVHRATEVIELAGGFDGAREHALDFVHRARRSLDQIPPSEARDALHALSDRLLNRRR